VTEFYGEQYGQNVAKATRPQTALTRSITLPATNANEIKRNGIKLKMTKNDLLISFTKQHICR